MKNFSEFQSAEDAAEFGEDYDPPYPVVNIMIEVFDKIAVGFFTIEYIIRFVCCPRKFKFFFRLRVELCGKVSLNFVYPQSDEFH